MAFLPAASAAAVTIIYTYDKKEQFDKTDLEQLQKNSLVILKR